MTHVVVCSDQRFVREALVAHLSRLDDGVSAVAAQLWELTSVCRQEKPHLVVLDIDARLWARTRHTVHALRAASASLAIVALVGDDATIDGVLPKGFETEFGVEDVIWPEDGLQGLTVRVTTTRPARGRRITRPSQRFAIQRVVHREQFTLTIRQAEVLAHVRKGATASEIASHLGISTKTVERHKHDIYARLGANNQAHAVALAANVVPQPR